LNDALVCFAVLWWWRWEEEGVIFYRNEVFSRIHSQTAGTLSREYSEFACVRSLRLKAISEGLSAPETRSTATQYCGQTSYLGPGLQLHNPGAGQYSWHLRGQQQIKAVLSFCLTDKVWFVEVISHSRRPPINKERSNKHAHNIS